MLKTLDLNWWRIGLAFVIPTVLGATIARLLWRRQGAIIGSAVGASAIFFVILLFFSAEYIEIARFQMAWVGVPYKVRLGDFNRYVIYAFAGFVDAAIVFTAGLRHEEGQRAKGRGQRS